MRLNDEMKVNEKNLKNAKEKTEKVLKYLFIQIKKNYHILAKSADELKDKYETAKINPNLSLEQRNKYRSKFESANNEQKDAEVSYIHQLSFTNNLRNNYIEVIKNCLKEYQNIEEEYIEFMKDIL